MSDHPHQLPPRTPVLARLRVPIIAAPMAGGPSTPALAAAVGAAGGLGFLAGGYLGADALAAQISALGEVATGDYGVNLFVGGPEPADRSVVQRYADSLAPLARETGAALGEPRFDDDHLDAKLDVVIAAAVPVVSFTFGLPPDRATERLHAVGSEVWVTVTSPQEAGQAAAAGADALIVQGLEAGGHRGVFADDDEQSQLTLFSAMQLIRAATDRPLVAAGAIMSGSALAASLMLGAAAAQVGSALLLADQAGTSSPHRGAVDRESERTVLTRAFSGRNARGIANRWTRRHPDAPRAYPEIHHLTSPIRAVGRENDDPDLVNLWAGQAYALAEAGSAETIVRRLWEDAQTVIRGASPAPPGA